VITDEDNPGRLIAARKGSPLVIGVGKNEYFVASDAAPLFEYTKNMVFLNDYRSLVWHIMESVFLIWIM